MSNARHFRTRRENPTYTANLSVCLASTALGDGRLQCRPSQGDPGGFKRGHPPGNMLQLSGPEPTKAPSPPWEKNPEWLARWLSAVPSLCPCGQTVPPPGHPPGRTAHGRGHLQTQATRLACWWGSEETGRELVITGMYLAMCAGPSPLLRGRGERHGAGGFPGGRHRGAPWWWGRWNEGPQSSTGHFQVTGEPRGGALTVDPAPRRAAGRGPTMPLARN